MDVVVTGIGLMSALGDLATTWAGLLAGQSGIQMGQPFPDLPPYPLALVGHSPTSLERLLRPAVTAALKDAALEVPLVSAGVVIGSSRGQQTQLEPLARQGIPDGSSWCQAILPRGAIATAQMIGSTGVVLAPMAACATGIWAIAQGYELLQQGCCQRVIVGAVEAPITPLTLTGFQQMGTLAQTGAYPFDCHRQGLVLGEGAAVFILESAPQAQERRAKSYGRILGFGLTNDAHHISTPDPKARGAIAALRQCLARSDLQAQDIGYIHAHGTGTHLNDQQEARLIQTQFPPEIWVSSTKGATGHTLGASGALGVAFCLLALQEQVLPPSVGLTAPGFDLNLVRRATPHPLHHTLCFSFGFGGQNAILALGSP